MPVSAIDCFQPALQHTRTQLFRPFQFGQWSRLALVGFLAGELHTASCNFNNVNFPINTHPRRSNGFTTAAASLPSPFPHLDPARIAQFAGLIAVAILLAIVFGLILLYISSVFRFILFDSVLRKRCSISQGWSCWHSAGRRYFLWQIVFIIAQGLSLGVLLGVPLAIAGALGWFRDVQQHMARTVLGVIFLIGVFLVFLLLAAAVRLLAKDFLVPIMALEEVDFADGWSRLLSLIRPEPGNYIVYLILKIVLAIVAAVLFSILAFIPTLLIIAPVVIAVIAAYHAGIGWSVATVSLAIIAGTVLLIALIYLVAFICVPATVFFPAFSIYFFASRYPRLDALLNPPPPIPSSPPVPEIPPLEPPPLPPSPEPIG